VLGTLCTALSATPLPSIQRGVRHPGGTTAVIREVQAAYDAHPSKVVATFDVRNAFNSVLRIAVHTKLTRLGVSASHLLQFFEFMYGSDSDIFAKATDELKHYSSRHGVRQGDMPASLLFSLVFTDAALAALPNPRLALHSLWAYLDDLTTVMTVNELLEYASQFRVKLFEIGLEINFKKCQVLADRCSPEEKGRLIEAGFTLVYGSIRVLGSPVGAPQACSDWALDKVQRHSAFWKLISHPRMSPLLAASLLHFCGHPKFVHLAQSLPPEVSLRAATLADQQLNAALASIVREPSLTLAQLDALRCTLSIPPFVHTSSAIFAASTFPIEQEEAQKILHSNREAWFKRISSTPFVGPLVQATTGFGSFALFATPEILVRSRCTHHEQRLALKLRGGIAVFDEAQLPLLCSCGFPLHGICPIVLNTHILSCPHNAGSNVTTRHTLVNNSLVDLLLKFGLSAVKEPRFFAEALRLDGLILAPQGLSYDITFVDSTAASNAHVEDPLQARALEKHEKYDEFATHHRLAFFPLVLNVYGTCHMELDVFVHRLQMEVASHLRTLLRRRLFTMFQQAAAVGNARIALAFHRRLQSHMQIPFRRI